MNTTKLICLYIASVGMSGASSGEVYARLMADGITLEEHLLIVADFVRQDIFSVSNHFITLTQKGQGLHARILEAVTL